jgi:hypothetical protein
MFWSVRGLCRRLTVHRDRRIAWCGRGGLRAAEGVLRLSHKYALVGVGSQGKPWFASAGSTWSLFRATGVCKTPLVSLLVLEPCCSMQVSTP